MRSVTDAFVEEVLPRSGGRSPAGWMSTDCPSCGDTRGRGGLLVTGSGGFRYRCFNGGCEFNEQPTGWEPGSGLAGRPRKLFSLLGGNLKDLPIEDLLRTSDTFDRKGRITSRGGKEVSLSFPEIQLPAGSVLMEDAPLAAGKAAEYLFSRGEELALSGDFMWSPRFPYHVIVPFLHRDTIVGWSARASNSIDKSRRFLGQCPGDFTFRQDTLERGSSRSAIVTEGVWDAMAVSGVAVRNASPTKKQLALLDACGQDIIMLPDREPEGLRFIDVAQDMGWRVSIPDWDPGVSDAVEACKRYGMLYTVESIVQAATRNYTMARVVLNVSNR